MITTQVSNVDKELTRIWPIGDGTRTAEEVRVVFSLGATEVSLISIVVSSIFIFEGSYG